MVFKNEGKWRGNDAVFLILKILGAASGITHLPSCAFSCTGASHKPSLLLLSPFMISLLLLCTLRCFFLNDVSQSSSHSLTRDAKEELLSFGRTEAFVALSDGDSDGDDILSVLAL